MIPSPEDEDCQSRKTVQNEMVNPQTAYQVTNGHRPVLHPLRAHNHRPRQSTAENEVLPKVEPRQAALGL